MEFSRPEYWSGYPAFPFSREFSQPRNWTKVSTLQADSLPAEPRGSPGTLEWVAYPFSRGSSQPRNWTSVSCTAGRFFTNWAIREARINRHECEQALGVGDGQGGLMCCIPWGFKESDTTEWVNWSELRMGEASSCYVWNRPEGSGLLHLKQEDFSNHVELVGYFFHDPKYNG